jgi:cytochrome c oxidase assembly protein subunit 15
MTLIAWIQLFLIGLAIGGLLLLLLWWRSKAFTFHRLVLLTVFFTFDLILFGAFTRLTDSGLGCPDWPGCYGSSNPFAAMEHIREAEALMPTGPVTVSKAWIEMLHRYFAMGVGFLIIILVVWSWVKRQVIGSKIAFTSIGILVLVCIQGAFGAWTVTLKLQPLIVSIHLMLGLGLLVALTYLSSLSIRVGHIFNESEHLTKQTEAARKWVWFALLVLIVQIFLGAWVSTNYAVLACDDFPLCHGNLMPEMNFNEGFVFWRELGKTADGAHLSIDALRAIHWTHRVGAIFALGILLWVGFKNLKAAMTVGSSELRRWSFALLGLAFLQLITGMSNIILDWPLIAALLHTGGAAGLLVVLVRMLTLRYEEFRNV